MSSYTPVFEQALAVAEQDGYKETFSDFHNHPDLYHFIMAPAFQQGTDDKAIRDAKDIDASIAERLISKGPSRLGGGSDVLDGVESRHITVLTFLLKHMRGNLGRVVEIGGGYGNCLRLVDDAEISSWSVVDMPYILELQKWFHDTVGVATPVDYISHTDTGAHAAVDADLVIGIHSLSEFDMDIFEDYYNNIIKRAKMFFYVSQAANPDRALLDAKQALIRSDFDLEASQAYESGTSLMFLFRNRSV